MAMAAGLVLVQGRQPRILLFTVMLVAFWYAGSRSGWIAIACVLAAGVHLRATTIKEVSIALLCAGLTCDDRGGVDAADEVRSKRRCLDQARSCPAVPSTDERLLTIAGGLKLFVENPLFGAGLGAFSLQTLATHGKPLVIHSTALWLLAETSAWLASWSLPDRPSHVWTMEWSRARGEPQSEPPAAIIALCLLPWR